MKAKQNIIDVAKYIIKYANDNDHHLSVFKLENLLYYINIYSLIETNEPMFDSQVEITDYGIRYPEIKAYFGRLDYMHIWHKDVYLEDSGRLIPKEVPYEDTLADDDKDIVHPVLEKLIDIPEIYVQDLIRSQEPYIIAKENNIKISYEMLYDYFKE